MGAVESCEKTNWIIPPPPPNKQIREGWLYGASETKASKRIGEFWQEICRTWGEMNKKQKMNKVHKLQGMVDALEYNND